MKIAFFDSKRGSTLVEVIVALFIVALVILGGGMFFFYGRVNIIREAHRRAAIMVASQRIEELRGSPWDAIALNPPSGEVYYIRDEVSGWVQYAPPEPPTPETGVSVDNLSDAEMLTELQRNGEGGSFDYLRVTVVVSWQDTTSNTVSLTSLIAPY